MLLVEQDRATIKGGSRDRAVDEEEARARGRGGSRASRRPCCREKKDGDGSLENVFAPRGVREPSELAVSAQFRVFAAGFGTASAASVERLGSDSDRPVAEIPEISGPSNGRKNSSLRG